jgi:DNA topoisomerase-2
MNHSKETLSQKYQMKTDKEHVLSNPDTYIGSIQTTETDMWILQNDKIVEKKIIFVPALLKLFDECIVNARDHSIRMEQEIKKNIENSIPVTFIDISIKEDGTIVIINDGSGIDITMHPEHNIWIPELIFGHLRTSTNYNNEEKKIVGGKNGFGIKLVFLWSVFGEIETVDSVRGLKYTQEFKNNLDLISEPKITKCKSKPFTKVTFKPDYERLQINGLSDDMISLFQKRVYDIGAVTNKNVKVKYNNNIIPVKTFKNYIDLYVEDETKIIFEEVNERWMFAVCLSPNQEFTQVSFVNGVNTYGGGKHVEYILYQITKKLIEYIEKKKKVKVNSSSLKEQLFLFINCSIENPSFNSQSKECLTTTVSNFGSTCIVSDKIIEKICKLGIVDVACKLNDIKENKIAKKTDGSKSKNIRGIPKLIDANWAGTEKSKECILILCEGLSAKSGIVSGLSSEDKNNIGIYPLKGKLLNVRDKNIQTINKNTEIIDIKKILGLEIGKSYNTIEDIYKYLRYGKILIMCDQDYDGSHIKGLIINLFHMEWSSLIHVPGFIGFMNTPILKAKKKEKELLFYNDGEYNKWKNENDTHGWNIKYYKGLGTSTGVEFKDYFKNKKIVGFEYTEFCDDNIDKVFNKKRTDDRKEWLKLYSRNKFLDTNQELISYSEFINSDLIHFSKYDCDRSIPNLVDGLKTSQRKIIYCAFKRNLINEIKVAQFSGYVSEHSNYHHGEVSLNGAIIGLAQNFVGSNNINLLIPNGTFGSRIAGGDDHASERYIFTFLNKITRLIFNIYDDSVLEHINDDGTIVEPIYYVPIIPMILVNGCKGIGTGFSTSIMCYNPLDIIRYLKSKIQNLSLSSSQEEYLFVPYYEGFKGTIVPIEDHKKFLIKGEYEVIGSDSIRVKELPIGFWIDDFKVLLEKMCEPIVTKEGKKINSIIKDYNDNSSDKVVDFTITFQKDKLQELLNSKKCENNCNELEKLLKLFTTDTTTNMHLFDSNEKLKKYDNVRDIIDDFYIVRLNYYQKRKNYIVDYLSKELSVLQNKTKYILELLNDTIDLRRKTNNEITEILETKNYNKQEDTFNYLIKMPMNSVSEENVEKLNKEFLNKSKELEKIQNSTLENLWLEELDLFEKEYIMYKEERNTIEPLTSNKKVKPSKKKVFQVDL